MVEKNGILVADVYKRQGLSLSGPCENLPSGNRRDPVGQETGPPLWYRGTGHEWEDVYKRQELKPAEGYLPNEENYTVTISENKEIIEITVENDKICLLYTSRCV